MFFRKKVFPAEQFYKDKLTKIFTEKKLVIDIGGGLRISREQGNRYDPAQEWLAPLLKKADYKILDPVPDYHPDIVGDIHHLPFADESIDAIICISVLEHVENPIQGCQEMYRVLKKGGYAFWYVPFLYYYHPAPGYYKDYWRFTRDSIELLSKDYTQCEMIPVRHRLEAWLWLSPLGKISPLRKLAQAVDNWQSRKRVSGQVSGYNVFLIK